MSEPSPSRSATSARGRRVFGSVLLAASTLLIAFVVYAAQATLAAQAWHETECTMIHAELRRGVRVKRRRHHHLDVRYAYETNGVRYEGTRWSPSTAALDTDLDRGRDMLATLTPGTQRRCWIDPEDPTQAVLDRTIPSAVYWLPLMALGFGSLGFVLLRGPGRG